MLFLVALAASATTLFILVIVQNVTSRERKVDYQISPFSAGSPTFRRCMDHLLGPPLVDGNLIKSLLNGDEIFRYRDVPKDFIKLSRSLAVIWRISS